MKGEIYIEFDTEAGHTTFRIKGVGDDMITPEELTTNAACALGDVVNALLAPTDPKKRN